METKNAIAYVRVSTDEQAASGLGLEDQRRKVIAYCVAKGFNLLNIYEDPGCSGADLDRKGLNAARQRVIDPDVDVIVFAKIDRLTRRTRHLLDLVDEFSETVDVAFVAEGMDTTTPQGKAVMTILSAINELELETIKERTRAALRVLRESGKRSAGRAPYGFLSLEEGGLMIVPAEIRVIDEIYRLRYVEGMGWRQIAKMAVLKGLPIACGPSDTRNIRRRCQNDIYLGVISRESRLAALRADPSRKPTPLPAGSLTRFDPAAMLANGQTAEQSYGPSLTEAVPAEPEVAADDKTDD